MCEGGDSSSAGWGMPSIHSEEQQRQFQRAVAALADSMGVRPPHVWLGGADEVAEGGAWGCWGDVWVTVVYLFQIIAACMYDCCP